MIQPNIPQDEKWDAEAEDRVMEETRRAHPDRGAIFKPDLVIWPESSLPRGLFAHY